jgi:hypothetical protein
VLIVVLIYIKKFNTNKSVIGLARL